MLDIKGVMWYNTYPKDDTPPSISKVGGVTYLYGVLYHLVLD